MVDDSMSSTEAAVTRRRLLQAGAAGAVALSGASVLAACGGGASTAAQDVKPRRGGTAKLAMNAFAATDSLDPAANISVLGLMGNGLFYDTLLRNDENWAISPALATDWSANADHTTWTVKLRRGVRFTSGKPLTADDVVASLRRVLDPKVGSVGGLLFSPVLTPTGIKAVDSGTVRFTLLRADVFFPQRLASGYARIHEQDATFKQSAGTG